MAVPLFLFEHSRPGNGDAKKMETEKNVVVFPLKMYFFHYLYHYVVHNDKFLM